LVIVYTAPDSSASSLAAAMCGPLHANVDSSSVMASKALVNDGIRM
jgi:hypothetical protein